MSCSVANKSENTFCSGNEYAVDVKNCLFKYSCKTSALLLNLSLKKSLTTVVTSSKFWVSFTSLINSFNSFNFSIATSFSTSKALILFSIEDSSLLTLSNCITNCPSLVLFKLSLESKVSCTNFSIFQLNFVFYYL